LDDADGKRRGDGSTASGDEGGVGAAVGVEALDDQAVEGAGVESCATITVLPSVCGRSWNCSRPVRALVNPVSAVPLVLTRKTRG
jgi:hypothetical protein